MSQDPLFCYPEPSEAPVTPNVVSEPGSAYFCQVKGDEADVLFKVPHSALGLITVGTSELSGLYCI